MTKLAPTSNHTKNPLATIVNPPLNQICTTLPPKDYLAFAGDGESSRCSDSHSGSNNLKDEGYILAREGF